MSECRNCGNDVNFYEVQGGNVMCPACGIELDGSGEVEELKNEILAVSTVSLITKSNEIRKMPVMTEADLKLKVAEVVYRVGKCVFNNALKKYSKELSQNQKKNPCINGGQLKC